MAPGTFQLPPAFDLGATAAFGLTGALAAVRRSYDVVGVFFLAAATALGGGLIRDGLFLGNLPPLAVRNPAYLAIVVAASALGLLLGKRMRHYERWIMVGDALGLGAYAVVGTQMSMQAGLAVLPALLIGALNATGGGLLRDVLAREEPFVFRPGEFYVLVAVAGAAAFAALERLAHLDAKTAALCAIAFTFALRLLAVKYRWRTRAVA